MQINGIYSYNKNYTPQRKLSFTSSSREYHDPKLIGTSRTWGNIATTTWLFRQDLDWKNFVEFADNNFKNKKHINTHCLACSDGSEAYSFIITAMEKLPKDTYRKYIPVTAIDRDLEIINFARSGRINLSQTDFGRLNIFTKFKNKYFQDEQPALQIKNDHFLERCASYKVNPELRNKVVFRRDNLLKYLSGIHDNGNSIVFCRNVTPYLSRDNVFTLANIAGSVLKKGSLIVFGEFDKHSGILDFIDVKGFEECMEYVFRKI